MITPGQAFPYRSLLAHAEQGIASRVLAKNGGGTVTLFAFDTGQGLSEHTTPYQALAILLDGAMRFTIGGAPVDAAAGAIVALPANVPHALDARSPCWMLLVMIREPKG
jgi:quercetin dioxygenase-like cupin family protein